MMTDIPLLSSPMTPDLRPKFWENYSLPELTIPEWEALCDGCGLCCLIKFEDEDTQEVTYTDVACQLLDCTTGFCSNYSERKTFVPDCISLTVQNLANMPWLPATCAYKRLFLGQNLPKWHPLITQNRSNSLRKMQQKGISVAGRCVSETQIPEIEMEERVIQWIKQ